jgi:RNA polymerase sigma-70 factor (ECF subfamily)
LYSKEHLPIQQIKNTLVTAFLLTIAMPVPVERLYNESELLRKVAKGDEVAFVAIFDHYQAKVFSISWKLTGVRAAAEDVVQEVFLKLWTQREKLPDVHNFGAWLNAITCNHIFNMLRKVSYEHAFLKEMLATEFFNSSDTLHQISYDELLSLLHKAIAKLSPQQKKVYQLSRDEGLKYDEIAERMGIGRATVKTHMIEAIRQLKAFLQYNWVDITLPVLLFILGSATSGQG